MVEFIAYMNGLIRLVGSGAAVYGAGSFLYGSFYFLQGEKERGKSHISHALIGIGLVLCCVFIGVAAAGLGKAVP